jgi:ADP-Ribosyltransferase in polyvalent proteins
MTNQQVKIDTFQSPAFQAWFGNSKVIDKHGRPKIVYHGTGADIEVFDPAKSTANFKSKCENGVSWFSTAPEVAAHIAGEQDGSTCGPWRLGNSNILPVFLAIKNPFVDHYGKYAYHAQLSKDDVAELIAEGYDGIHWPQAKCDLPDTTMDGPVEGYYRNRFGECWGEMEEGYPDQWAVFAANAIKSAIGNSGSFDPQNPHICA